MKDYKKACEIIGVERVSMLGGDDRAKVGSGCREHTFTDSRCFGSTGLLEDNKDSKNSCGRIVRVIIINHKMAEEWKRKKIDNFVILNKVIGKGAYGTVYLGCNDSGNTQARIAVKTVPIEVK